MKVLFKYNYTLVDDGAVRVFKSGEVVTFPDDSKHLITFRSQPDIVTFLVSERKKKK